MSVPLRMVLLIVVLAGLGSLGYVLAEPAPADGAATVRRWQSSEQCRACHEEVWDEWHGSHHQIAYLNPEVRKLSDDFRNKECQACHLPRPVSVTGHGQRTLPRQTRPDEGVGCLTCHLGAEGELLARRDRPGAPCAPVASEAFGSVELCASCHNQHKTTDQWRASHYAAGGRDCNSCHMPEVARASGSRGRAHVYPGAHDVAMLRAAAEFSARVADGEVVLTLRNSGAGHNLPTEERHRAVDVVLRFALEDGSVGEWQLLHRCRQPYRDEAGEDTQLPAGETVETRAAVPAGAVRATARLWYRLTPYVGDDDPRSTLLFEHDVPLP